MFSLGKLLELLLFGGGSDGRAAAQRAAGRAEEQRSSGQVGGGSGDGEAGEGDDALSAEVSGVLAALVTPKAATRPRPQDMLAQPWLTKYVDGGAKAAADGEAASGSDKGGGSASSRGGPGQPLSRAHERLNKWYDEFIFEGMTSRLAEMADG